MKPLRNATSVVARRRAGAERGAAAVVFAICSILLFSVAALAVDLGNAWSRKQEITRQADLGALAGGADLPASTASDKALIANQVLEYFQSNYVPEGAYGSSNILGQSAAALLDDDMTNGDVTFDTATRMTVTAPLTQVDFTLAGIMGYESTNVSASATVELGSPGSLSPAYLVDGGCASGSTLIDLSANGGNNSTTPWAPSGSESSATITISWVTPSALTYNVPADLTITGQGWNQLEPTALNEITVRFVHTDGTLADAFPNSVDLDSTTQSLGVTVPPAVYQLPGTWTVYIGAKEGQGRRTVTNYSRYPLTIMVNGGSIPECEDPFESNRLQLDSPRADGTNLQDRLALNWAVGLDHGLVAYPNPPDLDAYGSCGTESSPNASPYQLDDEPEDGNNCVNPNGGNDGAALMRGILTGVTGGPDGSVAGRLDAPTSAECSSRSPLTMAGVAVVNNDVLSCYLPAGTTLPEIAPAAGSPLPALLQGVLSSTIFSSPRFLWVPVVKPFAEDTAQGNVKYRAIVDFVPAFITSEGSADHTTCTATSCNGVTITGNGNSIKSLRVYAFSPDALPETAPSDLGSMPYLGQGTKIVRLVDNDID